MCGGFAAAIGACNRPLWPVVLRQLVYSLGRICTYAFLAALASLAGIYLTQFRTPLIGAQQAFSILAGILMLGFGLSQKPGAPGPLSPLFAYMLNARGWGFLLAGLANGFLLLVYSFPGLGTVPAMLMIGCGSRLITHAMRQRVRFTASAR